jgi:hypothetical protein
MLKSFWRSFQAKQSRKPKNRRRPFHTPPQIELLEARDLPSGFSDSTSLATSVNPSSFGQADTFTATLKWSGSKKPTGSVTFAIDGVAQHAVSLSSNETASLTVATLAVGQHSIKATYSGDKNYVSSSSPLLTETVVQSATTTSLASSVNPAVTGQTVKFTATVAPVSPGAGAPTGSVTFMDGTTSLGSSSLSNGQATLTVATLAVGSHNIKAVYQGTTGYASSTSKVVTQTINQAATTDTLSSSANPAVWGQAVTFTATVAPVSPGAGTPTGSVTFMDGTTSLGSSSLSSGKATLTLANLAVGSHSITAVYQGSTGYASSTSSALAQTINPAGTTDTLSSSSDPDNAGQAVTFTDALAVVNPGSGTPSGSVTFLDGGTALGTVSLSNGQAALTLSNLCVGTHSITAAYSGNVDYQNSTSSAVSQVVNGSSLPATNTVVVSSVDPVVSGQPVTFTAAVAPSVSSLVMPTGTVTFTLDGVAQPAVALANGVATLTVSTLSVGSHSVVAAYSGDSNFNGSTSSTFTEVSNQSFTAPWQAPGVNVTKFGVVPDGVTDNTTALQTLINNSTPGTLFYFPAGTYVVAGTVSFSGLSTFGIEGDVTAAGLPASIIKGTAATGNAISVDYGGGNGTFQIKNMKFIGSDAGETAFYTNNAVSASFENCAFSGHIGLYLNSGFDVALRSCHFLGDGGATGSHIGLLASLPTESLVDSSDFDGWDEGIRADGMGLSVSRSTFEQNGIGLNLGVDPNGNNSCFERSAFDSLTLSGNNIAIDACNAANCSFSAINIQGTSSAPSGQSQLGFLVSWAAGSTFTGVQVAGGFTGAAFRVSNGEYSTFYACNATNSIPTAQVWDIATNLTGVYFSNTAPATTGAVDDVTASQPVPGVQGPVLNVTNYGLVGDGATDNTAAFQSLINNASPGTVFYFPKGMYVVSATIDFSRLSDFGLVGDSSGSGSNWGSTIIGSFAAALLKADYGSGAGTFQVRNLNLVTSGNPGGICLFTRNAVLSSMENVQVSGNIGIDLVNPFMFSMRSVVFNGWGGNNGSNIGLLAFGGTGMTVEGCDFMHWQEGLRATGSELAVFASRFEVDHIGMNLGVDPSGNNSQLQNSSFAGISMEACDTFINALDCINSSLEGIGSQGSTNAPSGMSQVGLYVGASQGCTFSGVGMGGAYSNASILVSSAACNLLFDACHAGNGVAGGSTWVVQTGATNVTLLVCS